MNCVCTKSAEITKCYLRQACIVLNAEIAHGTGHIAVQVALQGGAVK